MKKIISPSILSADFLNLQQDLNCFEGVNDLWLHLDVMDGHFVPNLTFGAPLIREIAKVSSVPLDAHFMVTNPEFHLDELSECKLENFTFHFEASQDPLSLIKKAKNFFPSVGVSIKPGTPASQLSDEILKACDLVLVMSVEPGFGGQGFIESSYEKIAALKARQRDGVQFQIQVDGGVNDKNAPLLFRSGADNLVAGSFIFKAEGREGYLEKIKLLRSGES